MSKGFVQMPLDEYHEMKWQNDHIIKDLLCERKQKQEEIETLKDEITELKCKIAELKGCMIKQKNSLIECVNRAFDIAIEQDDCEGELE